MHRRPRCRRIRTNAWCFKVLLNDEEQYSLWPDDREIPSGWREAGKSGTKAECLAYIEEVWTDMRPKSLRDRSDRS